MPALDEETEFFYAEALMFDMKCVDVFLLLFVSEREK